MRQKQVPIKQTIVQEYNYDVLMAAYHSDDITQRRLVFLEKTIGSVTSVSEFEDKICLGIYTLTPRFVKKYWVQYKPQSGITYNKKTKTVKTWFGKSLYRGSDSLIIYFYDFILKDMNMNFIEKNLFTRFHPGVKTINRILKGKITNPKDFIASVFRDRHPGVKVSKELLWKVYNSKYSDVITYFLLSPTMYIVQTCENIDKYLNYVLTGSCPDFFSTEGTMIDLSTQAMTLNKRLSYCWSRKRLEEVHSELSREIAIEKFKSVPFIDYEYKGKFPKADFIELLTSNKEIFEEGNIMSHCVYSNYETSIRNKTYFVLKYEDNDGVRGTIGIKKSLGSNYYTVAQFYGKRNSIINQKIHDYVNQFVARVDVQDFFVQNSVTVPYSTEVLDNMLGTIRVEPIY